jgi:pimeloyl-ACP methyl ester carboxylesterase
MLQGRKRKILKRTLKAFIAIFVIAEIVAIGWPDFLVLRPSRHFIDPASATSRLVETGGGQLEVLVDRSPACGQAEPKAFVLEFCGNGFRAEQAAAYMAKHRWRDFPVEVWCLNYPGSGRSSGSAKMAAIPPAALATYDAIRQIAGSRPIFVEANSLGSVPAIYVASQRPAAGVIVQNPPPLKELIVGRFGWWNLWLLATPVAVQVPNDMNLLTVAPHIPPTMPTLFIQALGDSYVPPAYQNDIINACRGLKTILHVPGIGHNDGVPDEYETKVQAWIRHLWENTIQN